MYRVLLVDDEKLARDSISRCIKWTDTGCILAGTCKDGREAISFLSDQKVDIVLTDICMPYVDGMELCKYLYENHREVQIVIFSGYHEFEYAKQAMKYRVIEYLLKPVTARELSEVLCNLTHELDKKLQAQEEISILQLEYEKSLPLVRGQVLTDLLLGENIEQLRDDLQRLDITIDESNLRVAVLKVFSDEDNEPKQSALILMTVIKIIEVTLGLSTHCIVFQGVDNGVYLIFHSAMKSSMGNEIKEGLRQTIQNIFDQMSLSVQIGIGRLVSGLSQLSRSFEDAKTALSYRYLNREVNIWDMELIQMVDKVQIHSYLEKLQAAIKGNDSQDIMHNLQELSVEFQTDYLNKNRIHFYLQRIVLLTRKLLEEADMMNNCEIPKEQVILEKISNSEYLDDVMHVLLDYLSIVAEQLSIGKDSTSERIVTQARTYLNNNYHNPDLNLSILCQELMISPSYFSAIYKNATGETFLDTLNQIRLEQAKQLLLNTSLKNYEVAYRVGFSDPHYFNIVFKKAMKMTPKEFAKYKLEGKG